MMNLKTQKMTSSVFGGFVLEGTLNETEPRRLCTEPLHSSSKVRPSQTLSHIPTCENVCSCLATTNREAPEGFTWCSFKLKLYL